MIKKFQFISNYMVLSKKELTSKKDKTKKFYQITLFNVVTEELEKVFITKDKFDSFDVNNIYQVEMLYLVDLEQKTINSYVL